MGEGNVDWYNAGPCPDAISIGELQKWDWEREDEAAELEEVGFDTATKIDSRFGELE